MQVIRDESNRRTLVEIRDRELARFPSTEEVWRRAVQTAHDIMVQRILHRPRPIAVKRSTCFIPNWKRPR